MKNPKSELQKFQDTKNQLDQSIGQAEQVALEKVQTNKLTNEDVESLKAYTEQMKEWNEEVRGTWRLYRSHKKPRTMVGASVETQSQGLAYG